MLTRNYGFKLETKENIRFIQIKGIHKIFFQAILQFLYTDTFKIDSDEMNTLSFFLNLAIFADYFMIQRLSEICSLKIAECIRVKNVVPLYFIAQAHNVTQLEI